MTTGETNHVRIEPGLLHVTNPNLVWEDKYDYVCYVPSPRCASTSIKDGLISSGVLPASYFHDVPGPNGVFVANPAMAWADTLQWRWWNHFIADTGEIGQKVTLHKLKLLPWTVVRNPYDRIVSSWKLALKEKWVYDSMSLEEFLKLVTLINRGAVETTPVEGVWRPIIRDEDGDWVTLGNLTRVGVESIYVHTAPITTLPMFVTDFNVYTKQEPELFCRGVSGATNLVINGISHGIVPVIPPRHRTPMIFRYLKFENLQSDFNVLCDRLDWQHVRLPHHNQIKKDDFMTYHTEKTILLTNSLYQFEFNFCYPDEEIIY